MEIYKCFITLIYLKADMLNF